MSKKFKIACLSATVWALISLPSHAHGAWLAQRISELTVVYGHGVSDESYDPAKVKNATALTAEGTSTSVEVIKREKNVVLKPAENAAAVAFVFDNGFWTQKADGEWVNESKSKHPDAKASGHYLKYAVSVVKPLVGEMKPQGLALEIIPLSDPLAKKAGEKLSVRVLMDGKPMAGIELIADYTTDPDVKGPVTDAKGEADVVVRNNGLNVILTNQTKKLVGDPDADELGQTASLSFMIFDKEE